MQRNSTRRQTRSVDVGGVTIGGIAPISVQTMWDRQVTHQDIDEVLREIALLKEYGCDLIRFTLTGDEDIPMIGRVVQGSSMPIVADIHYNYKLALGAIEQGVQKIRINPGTIGALWKTREIIKASSDAGCAIRLGVNGGSLPKEYESMESGEAMVASALAYADLFEQEGFSDVVVSLKSSDPMVTLRATEQFAGLTDYPLHLGVTEAGPLIPSLVKSTYTLTRLLEQGIGDTIRVSISGSIQQEVITGMEILRTLGLAEQGVRIISCPKCGRARFDTHQFMKRHEARLHRIRKPLTIACMGCPVNGLDEARHADIGITGSGKKVIIFKKGAIIREVSPEEAEKAFFEELETLL